MDNPYIYLLTWAHRFWLVGLPLSLVAITTCVYDMMTDSTVVADNRSMYIAVTLTGMCFTAGSLFLNRAAVRWANGHYE